MLLQCWACRAPASLRYRGVIRFRLIGSTAHVSNKAGPSKTKKAPLPGYRPSRTSKQPPPATAPATDTPPQAPLKFSRYLLLVLALFATHQILNKHVVTISYPIGPSMLPTIALSGDIVLLSPLYRRGRWVRVGDIVSFKHPVLTGEGAMKRVIGMPGDLIVVGNASDAIWLDPDTVKKITADEDQWMVRVPEGHCWVVGDNVSWSRDSRTFGPVPLGLIKGRAMCRIWPNLTWFRNGLVPRQSQSEND